MSSRASTASSTDSYPSLYKSFSTKSPASICSQSSAVSSKSSDASSPSASTIPNRPTQVTPYSTIPPRLQWDREAQNSGRPYELRNLDRPFKALPAYLSDLGGLGIPPRKPCAPPPKPDAFHKRTVPDEIFHKRVTDASTFSITERPKSTICTKDGMETTPMKHLRGVLLADNVDSERDSSSSDESEDLSVMSWQAFQQRPKKDEVLRECKRAFFRARKELFKLRQYDDYLEEKKRQPVEVESWEISSESSVDDVETEEQLEQIPVEQMKTVVESGANEYQTTEIFREEDKPRVQEHQQAHLEQVRERMWTDYARIDREEQEAQAKRDLSPPPLDEEEILQNVPEQDLLNKQKWLHREALAKRLEEIKLFQQRVPKELPQTAVQFEKYTDELMKARRELRDEAILVDEHYKKAGIEVTVPEKDLQLSKYRAADHKSDESEVEEDPVLDASEEELQVHTCMTRIEWSRWMGTCTKMEKLKLPKVRIPRLPRVVHKAEESPIRMYIRGRVHDEKPSEDVPGRNIDVRPKKKPKSIGWNLRDVMHKDEESSGPRISKFVPYKPPVRPYSDLAKDSYKQRQARRRQKRELRKNHMSWINDLVEEICVKT